jgi:XRE family aerobic/anaerobic benzoate catabolism transcriptional regulator
MRSEEFLRELGQKLRARRLLRGLSQERLAKLAGLSTRYVSQLEAGRGNISIARLYELTRALAVPIEEIVRLDGRRQLVALIGLRGAGKSTVGPELAKLLQRPFVELDSLVEDEAGLGLEEIFALHGEGYYRRLEREVLSRFVSTGTAAVLATGGSLVTDRATYDLLKGSAITVWLQARPELHLARVAAQGDRRPMAGRADPLAELRLLLRDREPLYREAEVTVDTSERTPEEIAREIGRGVSP